MNLRLLYPYETRSYYFLSVVMRLNYGSTGVRDAVETSSD
jgi:hypothetical protein